MASIVHIPHVTPSALPWSFCWESFAHVWSVSGLCSASLMCLRGLGLWTTLLWVPPDVFEPVLQLCCSFRAFWLL